MTDVAENEPSEVPPTIEVNDSIPATPEREDSTTAAEDAHRDEVDAIVTAAYLSASKSHAGTSTSEGAVAEREEAVSGYTGAVDDAYDKLNSFCNDHPSVFNKVLNVLDSTWDPKSLDNTFVEVSKVIITGANLLSGVHPFVDVVVTPLRLILTFDQMRRQNNRKVTAVKMQILDTATALFRLRSVPVRKIMGPDGRPLQSLVDIAERIATDIEECSSACDLYLDKSNWSKFLKASEYEKTFADFMIKFSNHKTTLTLELSLHIAVTIEAQDAKIGQEIGTISNKIDALFRQLDTTREREVKRFIETKDGVQACIKSDVALKELAEKCGESLESLVPPRSERADAKRLLEDARKVLNKELLEDVDEAVKKHMNDFARKWRAEQIEVKAQIISSEKHIITVVEGPSSQRVDDIELREIWIEHKWKSSVAPHDFVLALNEYFSRRHHGPVVDNPLDAHIGEVPLSPTSSVGDHQDLKRTDSDQWAIEYINLAHLQPLLDVIDTDGSGLINVYEANRFTRRNIRPENWRLHHWVAFWAAGWHLTVMWYRYKIYNILQTMLKVVGHVKPTNIQAADGYLAGRGIQCVELLLRATRPARAEYAQRDDKQLRILAEEFHKSEEANVKKQLEELRYKLDNIDTIQLVTGALGTQGLRRIEVHVYPLLYLLLQRHLAAMQLACVENLNEDEFPAMNASLTAVFAEVKHRTDKLKAKFMSNARDTQEAFHLFAFGMFEQLHSDGLPERNPSTNTLWYIPPEDQDGLKGDEELGPDPDSDETAARTFFAGIDSKEVLLNPIADEPPQLFKLEAPASHQPPALTEVHALEGVWRGQILVPGVAQPYDTLSMQLTHVVGNLSGKADNFLGSIDVTGKVEDNDRVQLTLIWPPKWGYSLECQGKYIPWADTITGLWAPTGNRPRNDHRFIFHRPPGFRFTEKEQRAKVAFEVLTTATLNIMAPKNSGEPNPLNKARARYRCKWLVDRLIERRQFINLAKRDITDFQNFSAPWKPLTDAERAEFQKLKIHLRPCDARVYRVLAEFEVQQLVDHGRICDSCAKKIYGTRRFCIQCLDNTYNYGIDLCSQCFEATPSTIQSPDLKFIHKRSHLLLKTTRRIHDASMSWVVRNAKATAEQVKERFSDMQALPSRTDGSDVIAFQREVPQFCCCYCQKVLSLPFWACIECEKDTYVCMDCDAKGSTLADCGTLCFESRQYHASHTKSRPQPQSDPLTSPEAGLVVFPLAAGPQPVSDQQIVPDPAKYGWLKPRHDPGFCPHAARLNPLHKLIHPLILLVDDDDADEPPQVATITLADVMAKLLEMEREIAAIKEKLDNRKKDD